MLARVKQDYLSGSVTAFSGHEYIRGEWRDVPAGFEEQAKSHPLLEIQPSLDEIRSQSSGMAPGLPDPTVTAVTEEPPAEPEPNQEETTAESQPETPSAKPSADEPPAEESEPKTSRRRKRTAGAEE